MSFNELTDQNALLALVLLAVSIFAYLKLSGTLRNVALVGIVGSGIHLLMDVVSPLEDQGEQHLLALMGITMLVVAYLGRDDLAPKPA